jgi:hypothetical protein
MPQLVNATLEPNPHNTDGDTVVLYFDGEPTAEQIREVCTTELSHLDCGVDVDSEFFSFEERSTPVSERAGLRRYTVYPTI